MTKTHIKTCPTCGKSFDNYWNVYCGRACWRESLKGKPMPVAHPVGRDHPRFKGEGINKTHGRWWVLVPLELREAWGYRRRHMARARYVWNITHPDDLLKPGEEVHHLDRNRENDVPENLVKAANHVEHMLMHPEKSSQLHSAEARAKMSATRTGRRLSAETRAKMSAAHKRRNQQLDTSR